MNENYQGPVMLAVTNILRPPPARIGKISEDIPLPRTLEVRKVIAVGLGVVAGMFLWFFPVGLFTGYSLLSLAVVVTVTGFVGLVFVSWSPLRGESFARWLGLSAETLSADRVRIEGQRVRAYLGIAPLPFTAAGRMRIMPGAVDVPLGSVDERGVPITQSDLLDRFRAETGPVPNLPFDGFEDVKPLPR